MDNLKCSVYLFWEAEEMFTVEKEKERKKDFKGILIHSEWNKGREKDLRNRSVGTAGCCRRRRRKREAFGHGRDDMKRKWKRGEMMVHMANGLFRLYWRQILNLATYRLSIEEALLLLAGKWKSKEPIQRWVHHHHGGEPNSFLYSTYYLCVCVVGCCCCWSEKRKRKNL